jgi:hypothetical protein
MATRSQNERRFYFWKELPGGGRQYWIDRWGVAGYQRIVKIVDANEKTVLLVQEIYNNEHDLIERHQKYPTDTGHERLTDKE